MVENFTQYKINKDAINTRLAPHLHRVVNNQLIGGDGGVYKGGGLFKMARDGRGITLGINPTVIPQTEQDARNAKTKARLEEGKREAYARQGLVYKGGGFGSDIMKAVKTVQESKKKVSGSMGKAKKAFEYKGNIDLVNYLGKEIKKLF
jgi:hypothetical protein